MTAPNLYLTCVLKTSDGLRYDYTAISKDTEKKITALIVAHKLPPTFLLSGKKIVSDTILGFTDKPIPHEPNRPRSDSWGELKFNVQQQDWYKRAKAKNAPAVQTES